MAVYNLTADAETFTCNVFLVTGEETTLIDAGTVPGVVDAIEERVEDLDRVVLTHQHGDHVEQLDAVLKAFDPDCYAYADHPRRTHELADGDTVRIGDETCEAIYTPGHADDHLAFVSESTIYSGDVVVHDDGAFDDGSFGRTDMTGQSREELIESVRRILDRLPEDVEDMYAGHGGEFHGDVRTVIERALERAERREPKYPDG
ncbi:MBL fold metallo-hydrolase [Halalkalicoccus subterraneus]|uniref:MBL fold metallo-hydrolase n=1 Tax=Halalkalicoccus subterraneus TaxID=2675002 RepID=UPI000EFC4992|nr:MBL fold metallo-hydrolase [Halalkalicoccus subterraneus]